MNQSSSNPGDRSMNVLLIVLVVLAIGGGVGSYLFRQQDAELRPEPARPSLNDSQQEPEIELLQDWEEDESGSVAF